MTVTTNPTVTGVPISPVTTNARVTVNPSVSGIPSSTIGARNARLITYPRASGHAEIKSLRDTLTYLLNDGNTVANYQLGVGLTGTTNASAWANQIGAAGPLLQATGANQPAIQADGSLLLDGATDYMQAAFTLAQPTTVYAVVNPISWTDIDYIFDGFTVATLGLQQATATPSVRQTGNLGAANANTNLTVGAYHLFTGVWNGATSSSRVDSTAEVATGNPGTTAADGFTLGVQGSTGNFGNIQVKEIIIRKAADSAATQAEIRALLNAIHGVYQ